MGNDPLSPESLAAAPEDKFCTAVVDRIVSGGPLPASAEKPHAAMFRVLEAVKAELPALLLAVRDATLKAERDRLLALTPDEVVEEAAKAMFVDYLGGARQRTKEMWAKLNANEQESYLLRVRAALPVLLAPEVARREAVERERDDWKREAEFLIRSGNVGTEQYVAVAAERDRLLNALANETADGLKEATRADAAEAEVARLREALEKWGDHRAECAWWESHELSRDEGPCNCGLRAALGGTNG